MKDQVLSIEQMQKLKELGVYTSKASMTWFKENKCVDYDLGIYSESITGLYEVIPTFTLQDIIELMPDSIEFDGVEYCLCIDKKFTQYMDLEEGPIYWSNENSILINTYNVLVWLAKHNYI